MKAPSELGDIFRALGSAYREAYGKKHLGRQLRAMRAIEICRRAELGGHVEECDECGKLRISYNSCRNRHCPKCQSLDKERWLEDRQEDILPLPYFHMVFTVPDLLRPWALRNQEIFYDLLFKAVSGTLKELALDTKYLGGEIGFIGLLHTWTRTLLDHPHIHCIVPGGGITLDGKRWLRGRKKFFLPVKVLSRKFRGKMLFYLRKAYKRGTLQVPGKMEQGAFPGLLGRLYRQEWVVYCKPPLRKPEQVLEYLGRYTHRVALTNDRIVSWNQEEVVIRYRDSKDNGKIRLLKLTPFEFIRRFLLHILPDGFMKIRYYGFLSNRNRKTKLLKVRNLLKVKEPTEKPDKETWEDLLYRLTGKDPRVCPYCGKGKMVQKEVLSPLQARASP
jgi:hypothetical protein